MGALERQILLDSPSGYWPMADASGTAVGDLSGNSRPLAWAGAPGTRTPILGGEEGGVVLAANNEATVAAAAWQRPSSGTFEAWIQCASHATFTALCSNRATTEGGGPSVYLTTAPAIQLGLGHATTFSSITSGAFDWGDGKIHCIAVVWTYNGTITVGTIYADGVQLFTATIFTGVNDATADTFRVGGENGTRRITGSLGHAALFGTALDADRIASHHAAGRRSGMVVG